MVRALAEKEITKEDLMSRLGISRRTLYRWLALGRMWLEDEIAELAPIDHDLPWVELVDGQSPSTPHYDTATDRLHLDRPGPFRIHNGKGHVKVQHASNGQPLDSAGQNEKAKFQPKRPRRKKARLTA